MSTNNDLTPEQAKAVQLLAEAQADKKAAETRIDELKAWLIDQLGTNRKCTVGDLRLTISKPVQRLNNSKLIEAYPADKFPQYYKQALDTKALRECLPEQFLQDAGYYTQGKPLVTVK